MGQRLKVFITSDGLTDHVVATSSKAKALKAWGVRQDLFKEGLARRTEDADLVKAASAQPGQVLRRTRSAPAALTKAKRPAKPAGPSKAALKKVAALEAKLAALDASHDTAQAKIEAERRQLDQREEALNAGHEAKRAKLDVALDATRQALD